MPVTTRARERALLRSTMDSISHPDMLALVLQRLPPIEQCITVSRLSRQWHGWSRGQQAGMRQGRSGVALWPRIALYQLPLWCIREAWGGLSVIRRGQAALRSVYHGDVAAVRFVVTVGGAGMHHEWCEAAARGGQLDMLRFLRAAGCPCDTGTCSGAAEQGVGMLRWAHENGCPWNSSTTRAAAEAGRVDALCYAHDHGCPWDEIVCELAAKNGHLEALKYAVEHGCPWEECTTAAAAGSGHFDLLRWAVANGCPWDRYTCAAAAISGRLDILRFARENGCPWDALTCTMAACKGHVEVLRWAVEHGCPFDLNRCRSGAQNGGHNAVLQYLNTLPPAA